MSELDKISLNIVYTPAKSDLYDPKKGQSGLYYCGKEVNYNFDEVSYQKCGPDFGPNCPAWRTLATKRIDELNAEGRFQGLSGLVYCGKKLKGDPRIGDGVCGPDSGEWCEDCYDSIHPIKIFVVDMEKRRFIIQIFKHFTLMKLKELYLEKVNKTNSDEYVYTYKGKTLKKEYNSLTLEKLDIVDNSTLYIVQRRLGGKE